MTELDELRQVIDESHRMIVDEDTGRRWKELYKEAQEQIVKLEKQRRVGAEAIAELFGIADIINSFPEAPRSDGREGALGRRVEGLIREQRQQLADANEMIARLRRQAEVITTRLEREADMMVCPRCGDSCSEDDFIENPENFFSCPMCGSMQHTKCRGPMTVGQEVEKLAEREQYWAGEALKRSIKLQISESQHEKVQATIKVLRQELTKAAGIEWPE